MAVVLGHCGCSIPYVNQFLGMFRMPLFFFVSGFCFKESSLNEPKRYFGKRIKGLWWPFVKWCILFLFLHNFFIHIGFYDAATECYNMRDIIKKSFYVSFHMIETEQLIGPYWFLAAMFSGTIASWTLMKLIKKTGLSAITAFILAIVLNAMQNYLPIDNPILKFIPFSYILLSARTFEVAFLIIAGRWFAQNKVKPFRWTLIIPITIVTFIGSFYWKINTGLMFFDNIKFIPYQITGVLFTWCLYSIFSSWNNTGSKIYKIMSFVGKNTATVLTWHLLSFKIVSLIIIALYGLPLERLSEFPVIQEYANRGGWIVYFIVAMIVCCCLAYCNKWIKSQWLKL